jgi:Na+/H+ antiporter NhaD/arsenite permease-like protein
MPPAPLHGPTLYGIPVEFALFFLTLLGVALFHARTLQVALTGLGLVIAYKLRFAGLDLPAHLLHEWVVLANLLGLLLGFALLADGFERSHVPAALPRLLPDDWKGPFALLVLVFVLSGFLDNIAAAMIGGTVAATVFRGKVHLGYLAAIVAASNAGGAGSVVGDTTTTMMWIDGISPLTVAPAYLAAAVALVVSGLVAARQQDLHQPIAKDPLDAQPIDRTRLLIVGAILAAGIGANIIVNTRFPAHADAFPWLGAAVWAVILLTAPLRRPDWSLLPAAARSSAFLLSLVLCASLMPVDRLPAPTAATTLGLGFLSAIFDNIPLTKLALEQGGYDWKFLAYAVGYGGSMIWFGSSAGVALSTKFPEARSVGAWLRGGWHVPVAYVAGYLAMLLALGWSPPAS